MNTDSISLEPAFLLALTTRLTGGVEYTKEELEHVTRPDGIDVKSWNTERTIQDVEEYDRARKLQAKVRNIIKTAAVPTAFGLIVPLDQEELLDSRIAEAQELVDAFNLEAVHTTLKMATLRGRIAESKAEAMVSVRSEIAGLLADLDTVMRDGNVAEIRDVAKRAQDMGKLLTQKSKAKDVLSRAVLQARAIAKKIVSEVEKKGHDLADILEEESLKPIAAARFLFTGGEEGQEGEADEELEALPAAPLGRFAGIGGEDLDASDADLAIDEDLESDSPQIAAAGASLLAQALAAGLGVSDSEVEDAEGEG